MYLAVLTGKTFTETIVECFALPVHEFVRHGDVEAVLLEHAGTLLPLLGCRTVQTRVVPRRTHGIRFQTDACRERKRRKHEDNTATKCCETKNATGVASHVFQ